MKLERAVGKNEKLENFKFESLKLERTDRSWKVSLKLESLAAVGKFWLKFESLNELGVVAFQLH